MHADVNCWLTHPATLGHSLSLCICLGAQIQLLGLPIFLELSLSLSLTHTHASFILAVCATHSFLLCTDSTAGHPHPEAHQRQEPQDQRAGEHEVVQRTSAISRSWCNTLCPCQQKEGMGNRAAGPFNIVLASWGRPCMR